MKSELLIYIGGSGHSGSTLLDLMLGGHSRISALGEVHRLCISAVRQAKSHWCYCGLHVSTCEMWRQTADELRRLLQTDDPDLLKHFFTTHPNNIELLQEIDEYQLKELDPVRYSFNLNKFLLAIGSRNLWRAAGRLSANLRLEHEIIDNSLLLYQAIRNTRGTPVIVDSTKDPTRLKGLFLQAGGSFRLLYLTRDGRGVCWSRMRRQQMPMVECAKLWVAEQRKQWIARLTIPRSQIIWARYEDICRDPVGELTRICGEFGLEFEPGMLEFRQRNRHNIGGNPMRFREHENAIKLDEKWRREMSRDDLQVFERLAGRVNESLGYAA